MEINTIKLTQNNIPRREAVSRGYASYVAIDTEGKHILTVKTRYTNHGTCHAVAYIYGREHGFGTGYGKAGGYGYDKESAAVANALEKAGINVTGLSATGQTREALERIAKQLNPDFLVLIATGH